MSCNYGCVMLQMTNPVSGVIPGKEFWLVKLKSWIIILTGQNVNAGVINYHSGWSECSCLWSEQMFKYLRIVRWRRFYVKTACHKSPVITLFLFVVFTLPFSKLHLRGIFTFAPSAWLIKNALAESYSKTNWMETNWVNRVNSFPPLMKCFQPHGRKHNPIKQLQPFSGKFPALLSGVRRRGVGSDGGGALTF